MSLDFQEENLEPKIYSKCWSAESQVRPTPLDRKEHNEQPTNNRSQLQSCLAARTEAVAMASCLKVNSNSPNEHQSIKTARGTYERIIMRASFMEVTLQKREKRSRLSFSLFFRQISWHN
jgi:hypothetical protein